MRGLEIIARTISRPTPRGSSELPWQYHPRSDHHSKVACWAILFDLLNTCELLAKHVEEGRVAFGINHEMHDFKQNKTKALDLVLCTPGTTAGQRKSTNFTRLREEYSIVLDEGDLEALAELPDLRIAPVGSVLCALEAKACMTEHKKAESRFFDELNSSHQTVHGASDICIAAGFVMINMAAKFRSPTRAEGVVHKQPEVTRSVMHRVQQLPRRTKVGESGFDALAIAVVDCENDPRRSVRIVTEDPAPQLGDGFHYDSMIRRVAQLYDSRFPRD